MTIEIKLPGSIHLNSQTLVALKFFFQAMMNRRVIGVLRYEGGGGRPNRRQLYLTRMRKELKAYAANGNFEHLLNIANYAFLESEAPQNRKFHFDPHAESVARDIGRGDVSNGTL